MAGIARALAAVPAAVQAAMPAAMPAAIQAAVIRTSVDPLLVDNLGMHCPLAIRIHHHSIEPAMLIRAKLAAMELRASQV
jgi:ABC-type taurine transport system ATPase subunit